MNKIITKQFLDYPKKGEDRMVDANNFAAVIDGVTFKSVPGASFDKINMISEIILCAIKKIDKLENPEKIDLKTFIEKVNTYIEEYYKSVGVLRLFTR